LFIIIISNGKTSKVIITNKITYTVLYPSHNN
jgi:hypothetical protein